MDKPTRDEVIADAIETTNRLFTVEEVSILTGRIRQNIERSIRTRKINALIDNSHTSHIRYLVTARQVAAMLRTPHYARQIFVGGMPLDEARDQVRQRVAARHAEQATLRKENE